MDRVNADPQMLMTVLNNQHYVLTYWKTTEREINYRRFFTVNQLICLRMEDRNVFQEYHAFLLTLYDENLIQGFRIDHIDGLKDPAQYITNLRKLFGSKCYIIAEKILERKESLPVAWPLQGTSGYEFLAFLNRLFTDRKGAKQLLEFYRTLVPELPPYRQLVLKNKKLILESYMNGEWENLTHYLRELGLHGNFTSEKLKQALGLVMISLPVYRIYPTEIPLLENDASVMKEAFEKATQIGSSCADELNYLYHLFLSVEANPAKTEVLSFLKRMMQFTGPLTAKGVEDTTFYVYNPLISHDEVGDSPGTLGITIGQFHKRMLTRQQNTPLSLNATATHDTKRGEDVRARLNVLSEVPAEWQENVTEWINMNGTFFQSKPGGRTLSKNDEYFIYQSIVGGFPEDFQISDTWIKRLQEYLVKVVREAKVNSNWETPNEAYEKTCSEFIEHILKDESNFLPSVLRFTQNILKAASIYALGQVLVKITAPGIPDIYQGCELWDLSYVDPDNRRPVEYELRKKYFNQILQKANEGAKELFPFLRAHRNAGMEKLFVTWKALNFRRKNPALFTKGDYIPLQVTGDNQMAAVYARNFQDQWIIVAVPFALASSNQNEVLNLEATESVIMLEQLPHQWTNLFTGESITSNGHLPLKEMLKEFPVALLYNFENGKQSQNKI
jgi:(1->4)-alpha-D-glucan 1-alpha-D-glucosylmutase